MGKTERDFFFDPDDEEYINKFSQMGDTLERLMAPAMPCKRRPSPNGVTKVCAKSEIASEKTPKTLCGCIVETHESTRKRVESSQPKTYEDYIASKR